MSLFWVVAADASRARLFSREKKFSPLEEQEDLVHGESRLPRRDLVRDRQGQVFESNSAAENVNHEPTDPKTREAEVFARKIGERLKALRTGNRIQGLTLVAEPRFLGRLREHLDDQTRALVINEVGKSLTRATPEAIAAATDAEAG